MSRHVLIVNYNTPELTAAAIASLNKHTPDCIVHLLDNSDARPFTAFADFANLDYIDNTSGQIIDFAAFVASFPDRGPTVNNYGSAKHCLSIELILNQLDRPVVLMDSDILLKRDIAPLYDDALLFQGPITYKLNTNPKIWRVQPILCYINWPLCRRLGISYFNGQKMSRLVPGYNGRYDTGAWFLEQIADRRLTNYRRISLADWCLHFGGASYSDKSAADFLNQNADLWQ